jgi:zinc protease
MSATIGIMVVSSITRAAWRVALLVALIAPAASAQTLTGRETSAESVAGYSLSEDMPVDPEVLVGGLDNGMRFYVRPNPKPARRAELRLVVKAGSVLEDPDQLGLAHFLEHMQFEGTRNFPGRGINDFLASLGLSIGADANAATSFDDTQYTLRVPTDVPGALERALDLLADWAHDTSFEPAAIERQRAIVLEEWRMRLGATDRTQDKIHRVQLEGSRYAERRPIGVPEVIGKATRDQLVRFYRDWYRPDLMSVIVVGDVDRNAVAAMIRQRFAPLANPSPERPRPVFDVPDRPATRYAVVTDKEVTATMVRFSNLPPARNQGTVGGYRDIMRDQLFAAMLDARLGELSQSPNPPFIGAGADRSLFDSPRTRDEAVLQAIVANDGVARGLDALVTELQRVVRFGFTATELDRAKRARIAGYERAVTESTDRESDSRADEYTRNFLQREALPTISQELAFHRRFLPSITLAEINALAAEWFPEQNRAVFVVAPESAGALPGQAELAAVVAGAVARKLDAYVDAATGTALMDAAPSRGSIVKIVPRPSGITEWTLSNGATVVLQPTTLKVDEILFRAVAPGGTSLASDADFAAARAADDLMMASGVGKFGALKLDKLLTGRVVGVRPFIGEITHGMGGGSAPNDLEALFQLIYLRFTAPRADPTAFAALQARALALLPNQDASPEVAFNQAIGAALSGDNPRRRSETPETVAQWNLEKSLAFYKARFANAGNFTFIFVGSFTPEAIRPLVETYLASLPATTARESWRDLGIATPRGVIEKTVRKGLEPRAEVAIVFSGPFQYDDASRLALRTMVLLLQSRLNDAIREELGGTYSIVVDSQTAKFPTPEFRVRIDWACDPARVDTLVQRVFTEVGAAKDMRLTADQMDRVRDILVRQLDEDRQENGYLLNQLSRAYEDREAEAVGANPLKEIAALDGDAIQLAARRYLDTGNYVKVALLPGAK